MGEDARAISTDGHNGHQLLVANKGNGQWEDGKKKGEEYKTAGTSISLNFGQRIMAHGMAWKGKHNGQQKSKMQMILS